MTKINTLYIEQQQISSLLTGKYQEDMDVVTSFIENGVLFTQVFNSVRDRIFKPEYFGMLTFFVEKNYLYLSESYFLSSCLHNNNVEGLSLLLDKQKNISHTENQILINSLLKLAIINEHASIVDLLLQHGGNLFYDKDNLIAFPCTTGSLPLLKVFVKHGLDIQANLKTILNNSFNHLHILQYLHSEGHNCNQEYFFRKVLDNDYLETMQFLVHTYDINIDDILTPPDSSYSRYLNQFEPPEKIITWATEYKKINTLYNKINGKLKNNDYNKKDNKRKI